MSDDDRPTVPTEVTIAAGGATVTVKSSEPLQAVISQAQAAHREAHDRCYPPLPDRLGGYL